MCTRGLFAGFALAAALCSTAAAQPLLLGERIAGISLGGQLQVLEDPERRLTLADVTRGEAAGRFRPATDENVNLGYRDQALWLRLTLNRGAAIGPWMLEVGYPQLDRVEFYAPGQTTPWLGGDHTRGSQRPYTDRHFIFPIDAPDQGANVYHLRVTHTGTMSVPMRLWDRDTFDRAKRNESFVLGAYFGLLLVMVAYNFFLYLIVRDRAYAWYCVYVASMGLLVAVINGYGGLYLWPEWPRIADWAQVATVPLLCATCAQFTRQFLLTREHAPLMDRLLVAILLCGLALVPLVAVLPRAPVFWLDHFLAILTIAGTMGAGVASWRRNYRPARYYLIAFSAVIVGGSFMVARNLGMPASLLTDHGLQIGSALEVVLLSMGLADRINGLRRDKEQAQGAALSSQETMVVALRESERALETRVAERTEALEAANRKLKEEVAERERTAALLKESEERMRYQAQHDPLSGLPNRWLLRDRLLQATARAKRDRTSFAVLMVDLDNFKAVNDSLGHDVGDLLLVEVSQRLSACMRGRDTIARLGGDEFVFVLEDLSAPEDSALVARKIIDTLADPFPIAGELLRTSPSIGISLYPEDGQDPDFLLKFADIAMYRAKAAGRNCYRFYHDPAQLHAYDTKPVE